MLSAREKNYRETGLLGRSTQFLLGVKLIHSFHQKDAFNRPCHPCGHDTLVAITGTTILITYL